MGEETRKPALQVIVLGSGGGPLESNTTSFLVRSIAQEWRKGSVVAVDAGVQLSPITRILEEALASESQQPSDPSHTSEQPQQSADKSQSPHRTLATGPFAGLSLPHVSPKANAGYIISSLIESVLITHPHLDHIAGFIINTAGPPGARPKKLAGLPGTIHALKTHIFNNVIWPNLSDENNGAGLVTYLRLVEGGSPALGDGERQGYSEICDGLLIKIWGVSHGHCIERHSHRGSASSASGAGADIQSPRRDPFAHVTTSQVPPRRQSLLSQATNASQASGGGGGGGGSPHALQPMQPTVEQEKFCVYDSSAYFIQEQEQRREVLMFGDVEPDSISLSPRNLHIWQEAAPKVASGTLAAVFIECSYDDSRGNDRLFGHLKPVFVMEELGALAAEVAAVRKVRGTTTTTTSSAAAAVASGGVPAHSVAGSHDNKKRKRASDAGAGPRSAPRQALEPDDEPVSPKTSSAVEDDNDDASSTVVAGTDTGSSSRTTGNGPTTPHISTPTHQLSLRRDIDTPSPATYLTEEASHAELDDHHGQTHLDRRRQLEGLKVVIIHVKETLSDGPDVGETILAELQAHEREAQLGCEFVIARSGQSFYL